jgi:hypothetical protein
MFSVIVAQETTAHATTPTHSTATETTGTTGTGIQFLKTIKTVLRNNNLL